MIQLLNSNDMPAKPLHAGLYGAYKSGKTTFAASWPKPVFISAGNEGGDASLRGLGVDILRTYSVADFKECVAFIETNRVKYGWRTIVVDSLTYYCDIFISEATKNGEKPMDQRSWGLLDLHLQKWMLPKLMSMPFHILWIALEEEIKGPDGSVNGHGMMLYGKSKIKIPGALDLILRTATQTVRNPQTQKLETQYLLHTTTMNGAVAGGRFGAAFAEGVIPSHFSEIAKRIGPMIGESVQK